MSRNFPACTDSGASPRRVPGCDSPRKVPGCDGHPCFGLDGQGRAAAPDNYAVIISGSSPCSCVFISPLNSVKYAANLNGTFVIPRLGTSCVWGRTVGRSIVTWQDIDCGTEIPPTNEIHIRLEKITDPSSGAPLFDLSLRISMPGYSQYPAYYRQEFRGHSQVFNQIRPGPSGECSYGVDGFTGYVITGQFPNGILVNPL